MTRTSLVGVFHNAHDAQQAIQELRRLGFHDDQLGVVSRSNDQLPKDVLKKDETYAEEGALAGIATGAGLGAMWGLGIVAGFLPAIGPAIAGGILGTLVSSAAAGAAAAGLAGTLVGLGIPEKDANFYEEEFKSGRTIVTVKADVRHDEAAAVLRRFGAYDIDTHRSGMGSSTTPATETGANYRAGVEGEPPRREVDTRSKSMDVPVSHEEIESERKRANEFPE